MLELRAGKNRIFIKAASLVLAQVFLVAGLAYPNDFSCLRSPVMFGGKTDRAIQAEEDFHHSSLNDYFGILAGDTGRNQAESFVKANPNAWVMFGDMSSIRLMNTVYHPDILDVLIPMSVAVIRDFLREKGYRGLVTRIGLKGDEICLALPQYAPEEADNIRQEAQEKVASSITAKFWVCKVKISKDGEPLNLDNGALYGYVSEEAKNILGGDMLSGFHRDEDGVLMIFKDEDVQDLSRSVNMSISNLNNELGAKNFNISFDNSIRPFGLLSPRVLLGATRFSENLNETEHRAEAILNKTKQRGMEGWTEGMSSDINIPKRGEFKTLKGDRADTIKAMMTEEVSGVKISPEDFEPAYLALRQDHLGTVLENAMLRMLSQAMVKPTRQPVLLGLLDCRYQPYGEAWASLESKEDFNTQEKRAKGLRGQTDDLFGETVAFKYFNDALEGGHNLGNRVLEKEAKAILDVIKKLERHNIILFRGPPDNWYFVFLGPSAQDFSEKPELMKKFVDDISNAFDSAFKAEDLKLQVKARLRMNIVSSLEEMRGPFTIINQVKRIARSRNQNSVETLITDREAGANQVRLYKTKMHEALNAELGAIRAEERGRAIGFLTEKIMKQIKERANRNAVTPNDLATMRVMQQSEWLGEEDLETYRRLAGNREDGRREILGSVAMTSEAL
ncbi:MAG: hypothetical protein Q8N76_04720 [Candidatus Omnitrophota bacterium]|nr:hypothetical protein [Candidatus Omnitrophota bacterium]